jgi:hypothetical protein
MKHQTAEVSTNWVREWNGPEIPYPDIDIQHNNKKNTHTLLFWSPPCLFSLTVTVFYTQNESSYVKLRSAIVFNIGSTTSRKQDPLALYGNGSLWVTPVQSRHASLFVASYDAITHLAHAMSVENMGGSVGANRLSSRRSSSNRNTYLVFLLRCSVYYFSVPSRPLDFFPCRATYLLSVSCVLL